MSVWVNDDEFVIPTVCVPISTLLLGTTLPLREKNGKQNIIRGATQTRASFIHFHSRFMGRPSARCSASQGPLGSRGSNGADRLRPTIQTLDGREASSQSSSSRSSNVTGIIYTGEARQGV